MSDFFENWTNINKGDLAKIINEIILESDRTKKAYGRISFRYTTSSVVVLIAAVIVFIFGNPLYALLLMLGAGLIRLHAVTIHISGQVDVIAHNQLIAENQLRYLAVELGRMSLKSANEREKMQ